MKNKILRWQLRRQGTSPKEADSLAKLAQALSVSLPELHPETKKQIAEDLGFKPRYPIIKPKFAIAGTAAAFVVLVVISQSAQPGSTLYALKRGSEQVRTVVQPGFNQEDLDKRREDERNKAAEVQQKQEDRSSQPSGQSADDNNSAIRQKREQSGQRQSESTSKPDEQKSSNSGPGSGSGGSQTGTNTSGSDNSGNSQSGRGSGRD